MIDETPENLGVEAAIEEFVKRAEDQSAQTLENIVFIAAGLIDKPDSINPRSLAQIRQRLAQLDKNIAASRDVMGGVNLFLQTLEEPES